jgi:hypothetical protein
MAQEIASMSTTIGGDIAIETAQTDGGHSDATLVDGRALLRLALLDSSSHQRGSVA